MVLVSGPQTAVPSPSIDWLGMFSGLMSISYAFDAVLGTDRGGADSGRCPNTISRASVTLPFPSAPRPSEQAPRDAHSVRMCGVSRGSYTLRRGCVCGSGGVALGAVRARGAEGDAFYGKAGFVNGPLSPRPWDTIGTPQGRHRR